MSNINRELIDEYNRQYALSKYEGDVMQEFAGEHAQGVWEHSNASVVEDLRWIPEGLDFADCTYIIGNVHDNHKLKEVTKHEN